MAILNFAPSLSPELQKLVEIKFALRVAISLHHHLSCSIKGLCTNGDHMNKIDPSLPAIE